MFKIIFYLIITIIILHFILYYFNFDFEFIFDNYNSIIKSKKENISSELLSYNIPDSLNESINELKTLNECINNGKINTFFS